VAGLLILWLNTAGVFYLIAGVYVSSVACMAMMRTGNEPWGSSLPFPNSEPSINNLEAASFRTGKRGKSARWEEELILVETAQRELISFEGYALCVPSAEGMVAFSIA
jgi:hypothetical protein